MAVLTMLPFTCALFLGAVVGLALAVVRILRRPLH